jgi:hypothetical protein
MNEISKKKSSGGKKKWLRADKAIRFVSNGVCAIRRHDSMRKEGKDEEICDLHIGESPHVRALRDPMGAGT